MSTVSVVGPGMPRWEEIGRPAPRATAMKLPKAKGGVCLGCGCTPEHPCDLANGDQCQFLTAERNYCNSPACARKAPKPAKTLAAARPAARKYAP